MSEVQNVSKEPNVAHDSAYAEASGNKPLGAESGVATSAGHKPHSARALFWTQAKPCEEALPLLAEAYNKLADQIEEEWEKTACLEEQLETCQKAQHVQNLEWAISLAESDPLYAEVFRPYFQKIVNALASNPAKRPT